MSRLAPLPIGLAGLVLAAGCASSVREDVWLLPPPEPDAYVEPAAPRRAGAVGAPDPFAARVLAEAPAEDAQAGLPAGALSMQEVLDSVWRSYPLLSVAEQARRIARARQLAVLGAFDLGLGAGATADRGYYDNETLGLRLVQPTGLWGAEFFGGYRLGTGEFDPTFDGKRFTNDGGEFFAGASVPLLRDGEIDSRRRDLQVSGAERDVADAQAAAVRLQVTLEASAAYWRWVAAGRKLRVAESLLALAEERQEGLEVRVRRGDLPEIEALDNQRLVVGRRALVIAAHRALEKAAIALSLFYRDARGEPRLPAEARLPDGMPPASPPSPEVLEADIELALHQRPELRRFASQRAALEVERRYAGNQRLPQLDFTLRGSQDLDADEPSPTKGEFEVFAGLEFRFPVQNRAAQGRLDEARARLAQLHQQERLARDRIAAEVRDDFSELRATFGRATETLRAAELADRVADGERRRFALGDATVLVLNLREEAAAEARLRVIEALTEYWIAVAEYRAAVGEGAIPAGPVR